MEKLRTFLKFLKYFFSAIFILIVCFFIFFFVSNFVSTLKGGKKFTNIYTIVSPSMKPEINVYDVVIEFRVGENKLNKGDIITFKSDLVKDYTVTHRIVDIISDTYGTHYITKGDNNTVRDPGIVDYSDIYGKVYFKIPLLGRLQFFASTKLGWSIIILIPSIIILVIELFKLLNAYKIRKDIRLLNNYNNDYDIKEVDKKIRILLERSNKLKENNDEK